MASKKAEAIKQAKLEAEKQARWDRLELLVLAIAEKAGIDVNAVLESLEGSKKEKPQPVIPKEPEPEPQEPEVAQKAKSPKKKTG